MLHAQKNNNKSSVKDGKKKKKMSTSKIVLLVSFLICLEIIVYCQWAIIELGDASSMYALVGVPAALMPIVLGYYYKAKAENTAGGLVYESTMEEIREKQAQQTVEYDDNDFNE